MTSDIRYYIRLIREAAEAPMTMADFARYNNALASSDRRFCENCGGPNPPTEDGYTTCCNEPVVDKHEALLQAKLVAVSNFLFKRFPGHGRQGVQFSNWHGVAEIRLPDGREFKIDCTQTPQQIIPMVNAAL